MALLPPASREGMHRNLITLAQFCNHMKDTGRGALHYGQPFRGTRRSLHFDEDADMPPEPIWRGRAALVSARAAQRQCQQLGAA